MKGKNRVVSLVFLTIFLSVAEVLLINIQPSSAGNFEGKIETIVSSNEKKKNTEEKKSCPSPGGKIVCPPPFAN